METSADNALREVTRGTEGVIVQLKEVLERVLQMRVEVTKLEFDLLDLYHTMCPEELERLRDDVQDFNIIDNNRGEN